MVLTSPVTSTVPSLVAWTPSLLPPVVLTSPVTTILISLPLAVTPVLLSPVAAILAVTPNVAEPSGLGMVLMDSPMVTVTVPFSAETATGPSIVVCVPPSSVASAETPPRLSAMHSVSSRETVVLSVFFMESPSFGHDPKACASHDRGP